MISASGLRQTLRLLALLWCCALTVRAQGTSFPAGSEVADLKVGSVLFYNLYTSSASGPNTQNTGISMTNTSTTTLIRVHLFFVADSGTPADAYVCLTANQTIKFLASDLDPGVRGYIVAVAVDVLGCPLSFNFLSGDATIKFASGHEASLGAEAFAALFAGTLPGCTGVSQTAGLLFDGSVNGYNRAPRMLVVDKLRSIADGNSTQLALNRVGGNLLTGVSTLGQVSGVLYDDSTAANPFAFTFFGGAQQFGTLSDSFPLTAPVYSSVIPATHTGWLKLYTVSDNGMLGAVFNFNPNAAANATAFIGGHNLRKLTLSTTNSLTMPVFPPSC